MRMISKSRLIAVGAAVPFSALWLWVGERVLGPQWLRLWGWFTLALGLSAAAYADHKRNARHASDPTYLLQGSTGVVVSALHPDGQIRVGSELWSARTRNPECLEVGTRVRVCGREGLVLVVEVQR